MRIVATASVSASLPRLVSRTAGACAARRREGSRCLLPPARRTAGPEKAPGAAETGVSQGRTEPLAAVRTALRGSTTIRP